MNENIYNSAILIHYPPEIMPKPADISENVDTNAGKCLLENGSIGAIYFADVDPPNCNRCIPISNTKAILPHAPINSQPIRVDLTRS